MELLFERPIEEGVLMKSVKRKVDYYWNGEEGLAKLIWLVTALMVNIPLLMFVK
ncbi:MAG: hypothetical protein HN509_07020 [Halobacteriovoraceae bacterium]|jgi:hypothetical protein|nr:hypothetical protein [Halobacteriovoraceae bacterium]MBT5095597.1 hypothetical protein [Halobacteriovoraceae bacterium]